MKPLLSALFAVTLLTTNALSNELDLSCGEEVVIPLVAPQGNCRTIPFSNCLECSYQYSASRSFTLDEPRAIVVNVKDIDSPIGAMRFTILGNSAGDSLTDSLSNLPAGEYSRVFLLNAGTYTMSFSGSGTLACGPETLTGSVVVSLNCHTTEAYTVDTTQALSNLNGFYWEFVSAPQVLAEPEARITNFDLSLRVREEDRDKVVFGTFVMKKPIRAPFDGVYRLKVRIEPIHGSQENFPNLRLRVADKRGLHQQMVNFASSGSVFQLSQNRELEMVWEQKQGEEWVIAIDLVGHHESQSGGFIIKEITREPVQQ